MGRIDFADLATNPKNMILFNALPNQEDRFRYLCKTITFHDIRRLKALASNRFHYNRLYLKTLYWIVVKEYVTRISGGKCACGSTKDLNVHHLNYSFLGEEFRTLDCLELRCRGCHSMGHHLEKAKTNQEKVEAFIIGLADDKRLTRFSTGTNRHHDPRTIMNLLQYGNIMGYQESNGANHQDR